MGIERAQDATDRLIELSQTEEGRRAIMRQLPVAQWELEELIARIDRLEQQNKGGGTEPQPYTTTGPTMIVVPDYFGNEELHLLHRFTADLPPTDVLRIVRKALAEAAHATQ